MSSGILHKELDRRKIYDRALGAFKREKKTHYAIFCILSLYYHLQYFLCENVSKAINGQLHCLAINSSVIVACFYLTTIRH